MSFSSLFLDYVHYIYQHDINISFLYITVILDSGISQHPNLGSLSSSEKQLYRSKLETAYYDPYSQLLLDSNL